MMEYQTFCYLQNHKTGCTFVEEFLRKFCREELQAHHKHAALTQATQKFCFANVREPLSLYRSLFAYGLDGRGAVYQRLKRQGHGHLYESGPAGFPAWLDFVLRPKHALLLDDAYAPAVARTVGFMTWRFLRLACAGFEQAAPALAEGVGLAAYVQQHYALGAVLRQEHLRQDLKRLVRKRLTDVWTDPDAALAWLNQAPRVNASQAQVPSDDLDAGLLARLARREEFLYRHFYPNALPDQAAGVNCTQAAA